MRKKTSPLGLGGKIIVVGLGGLIVLFVIWQFVIPFFLLPTTTASNTNTNNTSPQSAEASPTASRPELEGMIASSANGLPLTQAIIKSADGTELAKTDDKGQFAIAKLPENKEGLTITAPGFEAMPLPMGDAAKAVSLKPRTVTGILVDSDTEKPIANRMVRGADEGNITDENGKFSFTGLPDGAKVRVELIGYETVEKTVADSSELKLAIRSTEFSGVLTDSVSTKPIANALIKSGDQTATTDDKGKFLFRDLKRDDTTVLTVRAPGYKIQTFKPAELAKGASMAPFIMRSVYVPGVFAVASNYNELFTPYLKMADNGEINAIILGMKDDDDGKLWYNSQVPIAKQLGLVKQKGENKDILMDIPKLLAEAKKHNLYVSARYVVMRDPGLAKAKPEWTIQNNKTGKSWQDTSGLTWPNPFVPEVGDYNAALAKELATLGFDEVQYDYIRFPTDGRLSQIQYKPDLSWDQLSENEKLRTDTIEGVVKKAYDNLRFTNTFLSLDVFGMSLWREDDNNIGQQYNNLVMISDYICPMVYASHFEPGTLDQSKYPGHPGLYPGKIIEESGVIASKLEAKLKPIAKYRPWLEDFDKTWTPVIKNSPERLLAQIKAAEAGNAGWTLWNANGDYQNNVLLNWGKQKK